MSDDVWGDVKEWGLKDHSDHSATISLDPVCGKQVDEAKAAGKTAYAGVVYYFCSKECQNDFEHAPGGYIGQRHGTTPNMIDVNSADEEELRRIFHVGDDGLNQILRNRPYLTWDDFKSKNPGFSDLMLQSIRQSGVIISRHDLHRLV
jgi:YHS domain-containing protein